MSGRALLAVACGMVVAGAALGVAPGVAGEATGSVARLAKVAAELAVASAHAEEMKFEEVASDTAARRRARRTVTAAAVPAPPRTPAVAETPAVPVAPEPPSVTIGKTGDIMRVGSDVTVGKDDVVTGDALAVGSDLIVEGHVEGNAVSMGGDIHLKSTARVDGDVVCVGGELHEEAGAVVGGKRVVGLKGGKGVRTTDGIDPDVDIDLGSRRHRSHDGDDLGGSLAWLLVWLLIGWAIVKIAPGRTESALASFRRGPGTSFLVGWLALVLTVPGLIAVALLTALLCITIIGIPLGIAVLFGYFLFLAIFVVWGGAVGAAVIGERIARRQGMSSPSLMRAMVTGVLCMAGAMLITQLMQAVSFIPLFVGLGKFLWVLLMIANILIGVAGWGALLHSEFTTGLLARWWHGRRAAPPSTPPDPAPPGAPPPPDPAWPGVQPGPGGGSGTSVTSVAVPGGVGPSSWPPPAPSAPPAPPAPPTPPSPPASFMPPPEGSPPATPGT